MSYYLLRLQIGKWLGRWKLSCPHIISYHIILNLDLYHFLIYDTFHFSKWKITCLIIEISLYWGHLVISHLLLWIPDSHCFSLNTVTVNSYKFTSCLTYSYILNLLIHQETQRYHLMFQTITQDPLMLCWILISSLFAPQLKVLPPQQSSPPEVTLNPLIYGYRFFFSHSQLYTLG